MFGWCASRVASREARFSRKMCIFFLLQTARANPDGFRFFTVFSVFSSPGA